MVINPAPKDEIEEEKVSSLDHIQMIAGTEDLKLGHPATKSADVDVTLSDNPKTSSMLYCNIKNKTINAKTETPRILHFQKVQSLLKHALMGYCPRYNEARKTTSDSSNFILYVVRYSNMWSGITNALGCGLLVFLPFLLSETQQIWLPILLLSVATVILVIDFWMEWQFHTPEGFRKHVSRFILQCYLVGLVVNIFCSIVVFSHESVTSETIHLGDYFPILWFNPIILIHHSEDTYALVLGIVSISSKILQTVVLLLLVVVVYACILMTLDFVPNRDITSFPQAFIKTFVLMTTANFPDVMEPYYSFHRYLGLIFVSFLLCVIIILENIILAIVYSQYFHIIERQYLRLIPGRQNSLKCVFDLLMSCEKNCERQIMPSTSSVHPVGGSPAPRVRPEVILELLQFLNPHCCATLIDRHLYRGIILGRRQQNHTLCFKQQQKNHNDNEEDGHENPQALESSGLALEQMESLLQASNTEIVMSKQPLRWHWIHNIFHSKIFRLVRLVHFILNMILLSIVFGHSTIVFRTSDSNNPSPNKDSADSLEFVLLASLMGLSFLSLLERMIECLMYGWTQQSKATIADTSVLLVLSLSCICYAVYYEDCSSQRTISSSSECTDSNWTKAVFKLLLLNANVLRIFQRLISTVSLYQSMLKAFLRVSQSLFHYFCVLYLVFHAYAVLGMWCWSGRDVDENTPELQDLAFGQQRYYHVATFSTYTDAMMTLIELFIVNNWHIIAEGYVALSSSRFTGSLVWMYFMSFYVIVALVLQSILTGFIIQAFVTQWEEGESQSLKNQPPSSVVSPVTPRVTSSSGIMDVVELQPKRIDRMILLQQMLKVDLRSKDS